MKLIVHMPVHNEADRYLESCLAWAATFADRIHVFDDNSTDQSRTVAEAAGAIVSTNHNHVDFMRHEGQFRQAAWDALANWFPPNNEDWVLCLDADEFLVANRSDVRSQIEHEIVTALALRATAITLPIPEVFDAAGPVPQLRHDGFWGTISGLRLVRHEPDGQFNDRSLGSGSAPSYAAQSRTFRADGLHLMHYGYAHVADRNEKYARYAATSHGHADRHIASIPMRPVLREWTGRVPHMWRGQRQTTNSVAQ